MKKLNPLVVVICLWSTVVTLPVVAATTSNEQPTATTDADTVNWEKSRAAYVRDLEFSSAAQDPACCNDDDARANLIKARYFIKLAEIDDVDLNKRRQAGLDLRRAGYYLALAKGKVKIADRPQIQKIDDEVHSDDMALAKDCTNTVQNQRGKELEHLAAQLDELVKSI